MQTMLIYIFWPITDCSSIILYTNVVTRIQNVVLRRIGGRGYFQSRDKDGLSHHSIRSGRKPPAIRKLHDSIFYGTGIIADWSWSFALWE